MSTTTTEPLMTVQDLGKLLQVNRRTKVEEGIK